MKSSFSVEPSGHKTKTFRIMHIQKRTLHTQHKYSLNGLYCVIAQPLADIYG